ncbi:PI-stichotoxin-Hcr2k-like [Asterias amurensis]|uniref:PI-stichotoxin-Hcr2k-like n=1 Tax=Asterias amurensis TaxID=7602 RepID=UPI003AB746DF
MFRLSVALVAVLLLQSVFVVDSLRKRRPIPKPVPTTPTVIEENATPVVEEDVCKLPKETGRCRMFFPSWYYDNEEQTCKTFTWGGCQGNGNRFETEDACKEKCPSK